MNQKEFLLQTQRSSRPYNQGTIEYNSVHPNLIHNCSASRKVQILS